MKNQSESLTYPIRINKFLAYHKYGSRRGADDMIAAGMVTINGRKAEPGAMVQEHDVVEVLEERESIVMLTYKPLGKIARISEKRRGGLFSLLDLEKEHSGLVVFTNDGRITKVLQQQNFPGIEIEYEVHLTNRYSPSFLSFLQKISGATAVRPLSDTSFVITLYEKGASSIRRFCAEAQAEISRIERTRFAGLSLKGLVQGNERRLGQKELTAFLGYFGL